MARISGYEGLRVGGSFRCLNCGYSCHADYNGALNILKRAMGYTSIAGADLTQPEFGMMKGHA